MMMVIPDPSDTILVVDDTPTSLGMLTSALEEAGYTVLVAPDGSKAIDIASRVVPNAILMDAVMPELDGFETSKRLKAVGGLQDVPVLFMTGLSDSESIVRGLEAGGVDYITKPVNPLELLARLKVHISNARSKQSADLALDVSGRFLLSADVAGRICWSTPQARALLNEAGAITSLQGIEQLPAKVLEWLQRGAALVGAGQAKAIDELVVSFEDACLRFAYVGAINAGEYLLRVTNGQSEVGQQRLRDDFNLTEREAEVLTWLTNGKSNKEIAEILDMSPRTVNKHLDRIFGKLGVENRTAAAILSLKKLLDAE